jgi:SAM-dependent methyltransferase
MERTLAAPVHNRELQETYVLWKDKPLIRQIYRDFYLRICGCLTLDQKGCTVELGAGFTGLKTVLPDCIATDLCETPWIDQPENVYHLSFRDSSVSNVVMMDVFHHLEFPGDALAECLRVLTPRGRLVIFEPDLGLLGHAIYGLFHHEPLALREHINWCADKTESNSLFYYAAQANAFRIFVQAELSHQLLDWQILRVERLACLSYVMAGGLRSRQLYPTGMYRLMRRIDSILNYFPRLFATRLLVVLEKKEVES